MDKLSLPEIKIGVPQVTIGFFLLSHGLTLDDLG